jgi:hypothetical protein
LAALSAKHQTVVRAGFEVSNIEKVQSDGWQVAIAPASVIPAIYPTCSQHLADDT